MALVFEKLKKCGVKISAYISGVPTFGSGIVYETPSYCDYNYVLSAKHILQEDSQTDYCESKISNLVVHYNLNGKLNKLESIKKVDLKSKLIIFEEDLVIIVIKKNPNVNFRQILVSDKLDDKDDAFFSWATFSANKKELHLFEFQRNDNELKRVKLIGESTPEKLPGMSGAGIFIDNKNILYGIISRYPNEDFELNTIDCVNISFEAINIRLKTLKRVLLDTESSKYKREINNSVVDIHQAIINNVCLDLELARLRLKTDINDDWFHDPLKYIDLLNQDYLFKQFEEYFDKTDYKSSLAEQFYVPKKKFTLRQALVSPFIDRIIYIAVVGVLAEKLDTAIIPSIYSARFNKDSNNQLILNGVEQWKKMQYALSEKVNSKSGSEFIYNCVLEIDLLNFYDNINKKLLIKKIERVCETENEKEACKFLEEILNNFSNKDSGLPQNSDASALLATFYLNQIDVYMQNTTFAYYRFMDDIRIFCKDKYEARKILQNFEYELRRGHLSVNSQKTNILTIVENNKKENEKLRSDFSKLFDLELNKISRLRKSGNYAYLNQAFHKSIELLKSNIDADLNTVEDSAKKLNYALNTIEFLGKKNLNLFSDKAELNNTLLIAVKSLVDKPWITTQLCKVLNLLDTEIITNKFLNILESILLEDRYNTYEFQTYQIWLLLAKHKIKSSDLVKYAMKNIEKNDETNKTVIASMIMYICSIDINYKRVISRKFGEDFTNGYFQNRIAIIALRAFDTRLLNSDYFHYSLKNSHEFTNKFKNKDLIYIQGFNEEDEDSFIDQLYSI